MMKKIYKHPLVSLSSLELYKRLRRDRPRNESPSKLKAQPVHKVVFLWAATDNEPHISHEEVNHHLPVSTSISSSLRPVTIIVSLMCVLFLRQEEADKAFS